MRRLVLIPILLLSLSVPARADESIFDSNPGQKAHKKKKSKKEKEKEKEKEKKRTEPEEGLFDEGPARKQEKEAEQQSEPQPAAVKCRYPGVQVDVRAGFAIPFHEIRADVPIEDGVGFSVPVIVDVGARWRQLLVGGYARLGLGLAGETYRERCRAEDGSCIALNIGLGGLAQYYPLPSAKASPWVGLGVGVSAAFVGAWTQASNYTMQAVAIDWSVVSIGVDFRLKRKLALGPFVEGTGRTFIMVQQQGRFLPLPIKVLAVGPKGNTISVEKDPSIAVTITAGLRLVVLP